MHIRLPKRTTTIDRGEKQIGWTPDGQPVWTELGSVVPTEDQKHELSHNLRAKQRYHDVQVVTLKVLEAAAGFFEQVVLRAAPQPVVDSYQTSAPTLFVDWLVKSGFKHHWDGLTFIVTFRGSEVARTTADVPASMHLDVIAALRKDRMMEAAGDAH